MEGTDKHWRGSPLDMAGSGMDAYGIREVVIEFDNGDEDIFAPSSARSSSPTSCTRWRHTWTPLAHSIRKGKKN